MSNKLSNAIFFITGGLTVGATLLICYFFKTKTNQYEIESTSAKCNKEEVKSDKDEIKTSDGTTTYQIKDGVSIINQSNNYINNIQVTDINSLHQKLEELEKKCLEQGKLIATMDTNIKSSSKKIETLEETASLNEHSAKTKFDNLFRYVVQTNLELCDTTSWSQDNLSPNQRSEILSVLQSQVLVEATDIALNNNFKSLDFQSEISGGNTGIAEQI